MSIIDLSVGNPEVDSPRLLSRINGRIGAANLWLSRHRGIYVGIGALTAIVAGATVVATNQADNPMSRAEAYATPVTTPENNGFNIIVDSPEGTIQCYDGRSVTFEDEEDSVWGFVSEANYGTLVAEFGGADASRIVDATIAANPNIADLDPRKIPKHTVATVGETCVRYGQ